MIAKIVVIYEGEPKERRFAVRDSLADALIKVIEDEKRFWEWEKVIETQAAMIRTFQQRPSCELLEKYMRHVQECEESNTYVMDEWCGNMGPEYYTKEEHAVLLELRDKIEKEFYNG